MSPKRLTSLSEYRCYSKEEFTGKTTQIRIGDFMNVDS